MIQTRQNRFRLLVILGLTGATFAADVFFPIGTGVTMGYGVAVLLAHDFRQRHAVFAVAMLASLFMGIAASVPQPGNPAAILFGRGLATVGIWTIAGMVFYRARAESTGDRSGLLYRRVMETAGSAIICMTPEHRVTAWNSAAERLYSRHREDALGKNGLDLVLPREDRERVAADIRTMLEGNSSLGFESPVETHEGRQRFILWSVTRVRDGDHPGGILAIGQDITERKKAEQELKDQANALEILNEALEHATMAAQEASQAKSDFLANMSHEIRTPMTAILGFSDELAEGLTDPRDLEAVQRIRRNGQHLLDVINDILDLSKVEAGRMTVERIPCSPGEIVAEVVSLIQVRAAGKEVTIDPELGVPFPEAIQTDPLRLRQILINLLGNAVKFTKRGVVNFRVRLQPDPPRPTLEFDVVDPGVGMSPDAVARLFEPFSQADSSTTREFGGTGLGLRISKRLARLLGGDLTLIATHPGKGSHFRLTIPTGSLAATRMLSDPRVDHFGAASPPARHPETRLECRILLVEDGTDNQVLVSRLLGKAGAEVAIASNGEVGVEKTLEALSEDRPFDVVLMDMQMPVMDGYTATRTLRARGYQRPIIALTASAMASDREECIKAGCNEFATKPINRRSLIALIRKTMKSVSMEESPQA